MKTLIIGLDGAEFSLIDRWSDDLQLLCRLRRAGTLVKLGTVIPPVSASAWASFATGMNPGRTGVYDFVRRKSGSYELEVVNSNLVRHKTFWNSMSANGSRLVVLNVPTVTWPPQPLNGVMISGLPAPRVATYPDTMRETVESLGWAIDPPLVGKDPDEIAEVLFEIFEGRVSCTKSLLRSEQWDSFIVVFTILDRIQHFLLGDKDREGMVREAYRRVDLALQEIIDIAGECVTVILSDHGATPVKRVFMVNEWLIESGLLCLPRPLSAPCSFEEAPVDWSKTFAYSYGEQGKLFLNLKGREPRGTVQLSHYDETCDEIIAKLKALQDKGRTLRVKVWKGNELYWGEYTADAPDIVFLVEDGDYSVKASFGTSTTFSDPRVWRADHSTEGILGVVGANLESDFPAIQDIAPSVLRLHNQEPSHLLDGKSLLHLT